MKQLSRKLHSSSGASMVIALMFFLVCAMVSSVVIAAASANVDRIAQRRQEQQAYLALSSAIEYVRSELAALGQYQGQQVLTEYKCYELLPAAEAGQPRETWTDDGRHHDNYSHHNNTEAGDYEVISLPAADSPLASAVWEMATAITMSHLPQDLVALEEGNPVRQVTIAAEGLPEVLVTLEMQDAETQRYDIKALMTVEGSDYAVSFTLDAPGPNSPSRTVEGPSEAPDDYHLVTQYIWGPNGWEAANITVPTTINVSTYTYTVSWLMGQVNKGGGSQ